MPVAKWLAVLFVVLAILAGPTDMRASEPKKEESAKVTTYTVAKRKEGVDVELGRLSVDDAGQPSLEITGQGPLAEALEADWASLTEREEVPLSDTIEVEVDGETVSEMVDVMVRPVDEGYAAALREVLQREFRYRVEAND